MFVEGKFCTGVGSSGIVGPQEHNVFPRRIYIYIYIYIYTHTYIRAIMMEAVSNSETSANSNEITRLQPSHSPP
jgi:hypothetical protein